MTNDNLFKEELRFLEEEGNTLAKVIKQEQYMNKKQENVNEYNLTKMSELTEKVLRIWSLVDAYKHFKAENKPITNENEKLFLTVVEKQYVVRFHLFVDKLSEK